MESFLPDDIFNAIEQLRGSLKYEFFYKPIQTYSDTSAEGEDVLLLSSKTYSVNDFDRLMQVLQEEFYYSQPKGFYYDVLREERSPDVYGSRRATYSLMLVIKPISEDNVELKLYLVVSGYTLVPQGVSVYEG